MWILILTLTLGTPVITSVPGFTTERACTDAGVRWEALTQKAIGSAGHAVWICARAN